jgi:DNA-binding response OmpR family regulator
MESPTETRSTIERNPSRSRQHILVVEDDLIIADLIDQILRFEGFDVSHVIDGRSAVDMAIEKVPDLILMDLMLPVMNGIDASRTIRSDRRADVATVPIVAMSAGVNLRATAGDLPVDGVLAKPFDIDELLATVGIHIRRSPDAAD